MSVMVGTPDWYHPSQPLPAPLVNWTNRNTLFPAENFGPFFVAPYEAIALTAKVLNLADHISFGIGFYADAACTISLGGFAWSVSGSQSLTDVVPVLGAYCKVSVSDNQDLAGKPYNLKVVPYVVAPSREQWAGGTEFLLYNGGVVAAAAVAQVDYYQVGRGPQILSVSTNVKNWKAEVIEIGFAGANSYFVAGVDSGGTRTTGTVEYSGTQTGLRLLITNSDASAGTFYARAIARG